MPDARGKGIGVAEEHAVGRFGELILKLYLLVRDVDKLGLPIAANDK